MAFVFIVPIYLGFLALVLIAALVSALIPHRRQQALALLAGILGSAIGFAGANLVALLISLLPYAFNHNDLEGAAGLSVWISFLAAFPASLFGGGFGFAATFRAVSKRLRAMTPQQSSETAAD